MTDYHREVLCCLCLLCCGLILFGLTDCRSAVAGNQTKPRYFVCKMNNIREMSSLIIIEEQELW